jgi:hypothetical protein
MYGRAPATFEKTLAPNHWHTANTRSVFVVPA